MARKKLEKEVEPKAPGNQKFYCCRCGMAYGRQKGFFPVSHSPMYRGSGYLPMCGECVDMLYDHYRRTLANDREAMRRMCMKLDLYWNDSIYDMVERTAGVSSRVKNYIGKTNIIRYIDKTFDDTLAEEAEKLKSQERADVFEFAPKEEEPVVEEVPIAQELLDFWGTGFSADFYDELERRYKEWTHELGALSANERALYKQICLLETTIYRDSAQGKAIDKNVNTLNTLLGSMNLKPSQAKEDADPTLETTPFGVWIRRWENEQPVPEPDPELQDVDGVVRYISIWFLGHLCKMLNIRNSYCKLYEDEIARMRIERPEYEDEDDETMFNDIFGNTKAVDNP